MGCCQENNFRRENFHREDPYDRENHGAVEAIVETRGITDRPVRVVDSCIIEVCDRYFLVAQINYDNAETIIVIRLSREQVINLMRSSVRHCPVFDTLPAGVKGRPVQLLGVFVVDKHAFLVLETEDCRERLIIVRTPLSPIINNEC